MPKMLLGIPMGMGSEDDESEKPEGTGKEAAAEDMLQAVKDEDAKAFASALADFIMLSEPEEE